MERMTNSLYEFDVIVIGGGHAGTEAALAAARMGAKTALLTGNLDTIAQMSCNPAIGGVAKGQIVREIDAMGGAMGRAIDSAGIQFRILNRRKGPAMHGPRAQADKRSYQVAVRLFCEEQPGLTLRQETVEDLLVEPVGRGLGMQTGAETSLRGDAAARAQNTHLTHAAFRIVGVRAGSDAVYRAPAVVLCAGTFMRGLLHYGPQTTPGGRAGEGTTAGLSEALVRLGFQLGRFKTGTPPRLHGRTIDYAALEPQPGDERPEPFSFLTDRLEVDQVPCWITYTNDHAHELIRANLDRAPMYSGQIQSVGPRYCPSIETKVVRFAEKQRHQLFLEPEGRKTHEVYVNGLSTSLPRDVQEAMIGTIRGLERAEIVRFGYAIEYDFAPSEQLRPTLETKRVAGLYMAGQVNGTTGYEEAAGQGLLAGANAALALRGADPLVLGRDQAYLGVMIDDLVTRGVDEPYRMFTSRAEHRLRLRHDNADRRLTPLGRRLGLVDDARWARLVNKEEELARVTGILTATRCGGTPLEQLLRRPETQWQDLVAAAPELELVSEEVAQQIVHDAKYSGYLAREELAIQRQSRLSQRRIPEGFDFTTVDHLRAEAREKLSRFRPGNLAQAGRISGITPADLTVLLVHLEGRSPKPQVP
jgi:tRNA uridine 5-carboxymethylaminomethyl modification enzyme